jgi:hypothetical protein
MSDLGQEWYEEEDDVDAVQDILTQIRTGNSIKIPASKKKKVKKASVPDMPHDIEQHPIPAEFYNSDGVVDLDTAYDILEEDLFDLDYGSLAGEIADGTTDFQTMLDTESLRKILLNVLNDLAKDGHNDFIFIKHEDARQYYEAYTNVVKNIEKAYNLGCDRKRRRTEALNKLTKEERVLLGLE